MMLMIMMVMVDEDDTLINAGVLNSCHTVNVENKRRREMKAERRKRW